MRQIFLTLTRRCTDEERHVLAWRVAVNGFLLLLGFGLPTRRQASDVTYIVLLL